MGLSIFPIPSTSVETVNRRGIGNVSVSMPAGYYRVEGAKTLPAHSDGILYTASTLSTIAIADFTERTITSPMLLATQRNPTGMIFINNLWVIAANRNSNNEILVYTSPDLITWTLRTSNIGSTQVRGMTVVNNVAFIISGQTNGAIYTSSDGISWTLRNIGAGTQNMFCATFGNGLYLVAGVEGHVYTSPNLTTWTYRGNFLNTGNTARAAAFGNGRFVIAGGGSGSVVNNIAWSTDTISWNYASNATGFDSGTSTTDFTSMVFADGRFVATHGGSNGNRTNFITTSTDGNAWTPISFGRGGTGQTSMSSITYLNGVYVAAGNGWSISTTTTLTEPLIAFSIDAINWVTKPISFLKYTFDSQFAFLIATNGTSILVSPTSSSAFPIMVLEPAPIAITPIGA